LCEIHGSRAPKTLNTLRKQREGYLCSRGWKDLIFVCVVAVLALVVRHYLPAELSDYEKWKARPKLQAVSTSIPGILGQRGLPPCLFIVPPNSANQPVISGEIDDCLQLIPDGRNLNLVEIALGFGVIPIKSDLYVADTIPLAFTRTYVPLNDWSNRFQIYLPNVYDPFLTGSRRPYTYSDWRLPDQQSIHYKRVSAGTGYSDAVLEDASYTPAFIGSRINWNGFGWDLALRDGTTYLSPEAYNATRPQQGSLVGIFDREGNEVRLSRKDNGDLTEIKSPNSKWIRLRYSDGRMIEAKDSLGNIVGYGFDSTNRLETVRYADGHVTKYTYDPLNRINGIQDPAENFVFECKYDSQGEITEATVNDHLTYRSRTAAVDRVSKTVDLGLTDPQGKEYRIVISAGDRTSYTIEKLQSGSGRR